jgi:acyl dehydratase
MSWNWKDVALYNIGIGAYDLKYTFESFKEGLKLVPSFAVVPPLPLLIQSVGKMGANPFTLLHGEQTVIIKQPNLPVKADVISEGKVTDVYDKGKGALFLLKTTTKTTAGEELFDNIFTLFCRGEGGFGGPNSPEVGNEPLTREPDVVFTESTYPIQNLIYRLSGDINPLHIDPGFAKMGGFAKPILHGLCSYGYVCRAVIKNILNDDPTRVREYFVRFRGVVYPGDTLTTKIWKVEEGKVIMEAKTQDDRVVIANASIKYV